MSTGPDHFRVIPLKLNLSEGLLSHITVVKILLQPDENPLGHHLVQIFGVSGEVAQPGDTTITNQALRIPQPLVVWSI